MNIRQTLNELTTPELRSILSAPRQKVDKVAALFDTKSKIVRVVTRSILAHRWHDQSVPSGKKRGRPSRGEVLPPADFAHLRETTGMTVKELARHFDVSVARVKRWIAASGTARMKPTATRLSAHVKLDTKEFKTRTDAEIAQETGLPLHVVTGRRLEAGVRKRRGVAPKFSIEYLLEQAKAGKTCTEIAEQTGQTRQNVSARLIDAGFPLSGRYE